MSNTIGTKTIGIVDYGSGNLRSVAKAFEHSAGSHATIRVTSNSSELAKCSHVVLPGVGAFGDCMQGLSALDGMIEMLESHVHTAQKPFLGICVGMQLLFETGLEHGTHKGLGWLKGAVEPIKPARGLKIPHMGWNNLDIKSDHPIFAEIENNAHAYFVHSYQAHCTEENSVENSVLATVEYGQTITAVVGRDHIMGTQFHPEKSQETGLKLIRNFINV